MDDPYEMYDFPPKRRVTYGKSVKKRTPPVGGVSGGGGSTTELSAPSAASTSHSSSPEPAPRSRPPVVAKAKRLPVGNNPRSAQRRVPKQVNSQPLPTSMSSGDGLLQDEDATMKKRKLTRTYSERKIEAFDSYDFPASPPPPSRSTKRSSPENDTDEDKTPRPARIAKPVVRSETPPSEDVMMKDVASQSPMPFSAKTSRALVNLNVSSEMSTKTKQQIPLRLSREPPALTRPAAKRRPSTSPTPSRSHGAVNPGPRKKRLIDTLAEQAEESEEEEQSQQTLQPEVVSRPKPDIEFTFRDTSPAPNSEPQAPRAVVRSVVGPKKTGPRFTYSQQRTMLAEDDDIFGLGLGEITEEANSGSMFNFGRLPQNLASNRFSFLDEDDETVNTGAVRSLHELRQAGANSRFADEMDDIMDRIGSPSTKPSSLRRGALLELAQKISNQSFRRQFRNHGDDGNLFKTLGEETDMVSGFSILAIIATLLAASSSAHLVQQLRAQGFATLLNRLLGEAVDITLLARDRKQNASRHAQNTLGTIKASLLALPIWEPCSPTSLSPRSLALKCLNLIMMQPSHSSSEGDIFTPTVMDRLFSILSASLSNEAGWEFPRQQESTDFYLALYVLDTHSINAMESGLASTWNRQYVPTIVSVLETTLHRPLEKFNDIESLALRLTLNVTNNNANACQIFVDQELLQELAKSACDLFEMVLRSMKEDAFLAKVHESLVLMLAVMINLCAYYPSASRSLEGDKDGSTSSLDRLIRMFADNHSKTSDADSMEKTHLNVALGYLAILLGYLCLSMPVRNRFLVVHPKKSIQPLLDSINEFIAVSHKVAEVQGSQFRAMARLQSLVGQLMA